MAEVGNRLVGAVLWAVRDAALHLSRLAVLAEWRRRGIARALLAAAERVAGAQHLRCLALGTRLVLTDNRRLFAALGFVETVQHTHDGYSTPTWVELEERLDR